MRMNLEFGGIRGPSKRAAPLHAQSHERTAFKRQCHFSEDGCYWALILLLLVAIPAVTSCLMSVCTWVDSAFHVADAAALVAHKVHSTHHIDCYTMRISMQLVCCQKSQHRSSRAFGLLQSKLSRTPRRPCRICALYRTKAALLSRCVLVSDWLALLYIAKPSFILLVYSANSIVCSRKVPIFDLLQRFVLPVTSAQEFGFFSTPLIAKNPLFHHARNSCEVTSYADRYYSMSGRSPYAKKPES